MVELVALVLEDRRLAEYGESVGEALGHQKLPVVLRRQLHRHVLPEGGRSAADVHRHVQHRAEHATHQLGLGVGRILVMQATHHAVAGHRFVVLDEVHRVAQHRRHLGVEVALREALEEVAPRVGEHPRLQDQEALDICLNDVHLQCI